MDQRALFFFIAAAMAALLVPVTDDSLRYVPTIVSVVYVILAAASYLDWRTNKR
jgi:flagellar biosynthesis protein FliQ